VEYDYEINSWDKTKPFLWQKSYIERDKTETRLLKEKVNYEQENLVAIDKKWDRSEQTREERRKERKLQLERENREQTRQLEELQKWKEERQEKLDQMKLDMNEKYQRKYQRFDNQIDQDLDELNSKSSLQLEILRKGRQRQESEQTSDDPTFVHKPRILSLQPNKTLEKRLANYKPDPEPNLPKKSVSSDEEDSEQEKITKEEEKEDRHEEGDSQPQIEIPSDLSEDNNAQKDIVLQSLEVQFSENVINELDPPPQISDNLSQISENTFPDTEIDHPGPISENTSQLTENTSQDNEPPISPKISQQQLEDSPHNIISQTHVFEDYPNIPKEASIPDQEEDQTNLPEQNPIKLTDQPEN